MIQGRNNLGFLGILTILSFVVGVYALEIALKNLDENRLQTDDTQRILDDLENHLKTQDLHLASQDRVLENITK
ncbi:MAG: hypothetical protein VZQ62_00540 [Methanosphaera sp.]|nr:hypothetical protein [Methanosphaera sp.]